MKMIPMLLAVTIACVGPNIGAEEAVEEIPQDKEQTERLLKIKQASAIQKKIIEATRTGMPDMGPRTAPIQILAFTAASSMSIKSITEIKHTITQYPGKVRIVFKFTDDGKAEAACWAAAQQNKLWDMYQAVMSAPGDTERYVETAKKLELDQARLDSDMKSKEFKDQVKQNQALMEEIKVSELPTFFVNTQRHVGAKGLSRVVFEHLNFGTRQIRMRE